MNLRFSMMVFNERMEIQGIPTISDVTDVSWTHVKQGLG